VCVEGLERRRPYVILGKDVSYVWITKCQEDYWGPWGMGFTHECIMHSCTPKYWNARAAWNCDRSTVFTSARFTLSRTALFRKIHDISDVTTGRRIFADVSEERNALIFGVKQPRTTVISLSGWRLVPSGALNVWRLYFSGTLIRVSVITGKAPHSTFQERNPGVK